MTEPILTHSYSGLAFPATPEFKRGDKLYWTRSPEPERITGAFRIVERDGDVVLLGNGEAPEGYWQVWAWDIDD